MPSSRLIAEPLAYPYLTTSNSLRNAVPHGAADAAAAAGHQGLSAFEIGLATHRVITAFPDTLVPEPYNVRYFAFTSSRSARKCSSGA